MKLNISPDLSLPIDAVTQTFSLLARRGAGKTHAASVMAEEYLAAGYPIVWLDPIGVAWGLRSKYSIAILGGEHADVPLEPHGGKVVADFVVAQRIPVILDVSMFGENEMRRFVADFAQRFYHTNREAIHWFVDEADEFAPQNASGGPLAQCLGAMQNIVRRGRARGIGVTLITQRSAVLNKSVLTQTECLIAMQTTAPHDLRAIDDWIKYHGTQEERDKIMHDLPMLQQGEAWVYSPGWLKILKRVKFRARHSFDSSRTPKPGEQTKSPRSLADVDLSKLTADLKATIEKAKADDPRELRKKIADLENLLRQSESAAPGMESLIQARDEGRREAARQFEAWRKTKENELANAKQFLRQIEQACQEVGKILTPPFRMEAIEQLATIAYGAPETTRPSHAAPRRHTLPVQASSDGQTSVSPAGLRRMLIALAQRRQGLTDRQLGTRAKVSVNGGSFDTYLSKARTNSWITGDRSCLTITQTGLEALGNYEPLPWGPALIAYWRSKLVAGAGRMLDAIVQAYPNTITDVDLGAQANVSVDGGSFDTYLSRLRTLELVTGKRDALRASEELFS